jgi:hypothetical protein
MFWKLKVILCLIFKYCETLGSSTLLTSRSQIEKLPLLETDPPVSPQGCHMVTEELHSITFETQICLYGLTINLEVGFSRNIC